MERRLLAILSADAVGYTRLMAEDERGTIETLNAYRRLIGGLISEHRGRVVDAPGDNVLAQFPNALDAVKCAVEIQDALLERNESLPDGRRMHFRVGIHLGDVTVEDGRIYGDGVNVAARLERLAQPGGICISGEVHTQVRNRLDLPFEDLGGQRLKNVAEPVRTYRVAAETAAPPTASRWTRTALAAVAVLALGGVAGLGWWALDRQGSATETPGVGATAHRSRSAGEARMPALAVLPFENMSGDPEQEYFAEGLAEDLITRLTSGQFPVVARNSSFAYKGRSVDVKQIGQELGVQYVMEGSVRRSGERVRVNAQLIDAREGLHVWAEQYDRELTDIFGVQDEIVDAIAASTFLPVFESEQERAMRAPAHALDAWDLSMRGTWHVNRGGRENTEKARAYYLRALELEPGLAPALAGLAQTHMEDLYSYRSADREQSLDILNRVARQAIEADRKNAHAHWVLAQAHRLSGETHRSIEEFERAIELSPFSGAAYNGLGQAYAWNGQADRAIPLLERALELAPPGRYRYAATYPLGFAHYVAGDHDAALRWAEEAVRWGSEWEPESEARALRLLAVCNHAAGRPAEAREALVESLRLNPHFSVAALREVVAFGAPEISGAYVDALLASGLAELQGRPSS